MKISIQYLAVLSRFIIIIIQCIANNLIPDHDAGVFISPRNPMGTKKYDWLIDYLFGGLRKWDAQYFLHIVEYGYTYENTLAFFPLFPLCVRILAQLLQHIIPYFSLHEIALIVAIAFNVCFFAKAAQALYDLSKIVLGNRIRAKLAVALFCINPASIFFTAPYSESLFAWLTFSYMKQAVKDISVSLTFPLTLSILCRSNGLVNIGFLLYFAMRKIISELCVKTFLTVVFKSAVILFFVLFHFGLLQAYHFYLFCHQLNIKFPEHIVNYAMEHNLVMAGNKTELTSPWCSHPIPVAYNYVQDHYWNVGLFNYYQLKQIPNFLLALPIVWIILNKFINYIRMNSSYSIRLGIFVTDSMISAMRRVDIQYFVFIIHATVLTIFCILYVHIQVTTRMLASSSPLLYWIVADVFHYAKTMNPSEEHRKFHEKNKRKIYNTDEETDIIDMSFLQQIFLEKTNRNGRILTIWFISYFVIGAILFSNSLPWT